MVNTDVQTIHFNHDDNTISVPEQLIYSMSRPEPEDNTISIPEQYIHPTTRDQTGTLTTYRSEPVFSDRLDDDTGDKPKSTSFRAVRSQRTAQFEQKNKYPEKYDTTNDKKPVSEHLEDKQQKHNQVDSNTGSVNENCINTKDLAELNTISVLETTNKYCPEKDSITLASDKVDKACSRVIPELCMKKKMIDNNQLGGENGFNQCDTEKSKADNPDIMRKITADVTGNTRICISNQNANKDAKLFHEDLVTHLADKTEIANHIETKDKDDISVQEKKLEFSVVYPTNESTVEAESSHLYDEQEVTCTQIESIEDVSYLTISTREPGDIEKNQMTQNDFIPSERPTFKDMPHFSHNSDQNALFDGEICRSISASYQAPDFVHSQNLGPQSVHGKENEPVTPPDFVSDGKIDSYVTHAPKTFTADTDMSPESNERFISFLVRDSAPLTQPSRNISLAGFIDGIPVTLIDTGANVSAICADVWKRIPQKTKHPPIPTPITSIAAVNGQSIPVLGQDKLPFSINGSTYPFHVLIIESIAYDVILGRDFLEAYKAKIDLQDHVLELQHDVSSSEQFDFTHMPDVSEPTVCSIHATSSFILPPNSEVVVPGELGKNFQLGEVGLVNPRDELPHRYNIMGASQVVKTWERNSVPVRLLNPTDQPIKIFRRTRLGEFTPVDPTIATYDLLQSDIEAEATRDIPTALDKEPRTPLNVDRSKLSEEQQTKLDALLVKYDDIFAYTPDQLGRSSIVQHRIDTGDHPPVRLRSYRTSPANREEIDKQITEMLDNGVISPSVSPWAAPVVLVKKSDGTMRFCVDYRKLNAITRKDSHPLPRITEALDSLGGAGWFTTLDLRSGYWQILMSEDSKEKTAFITHNGLYEFNVLPFGLCNSPATFQRLMTHALRGLEWDICLVYIDDLIIFSRTFEDHLLHVEKVFKRLKEANVRLKPSKCYFVQSQVEYLGHIVSAEGLRPNPNKIKAVKDFPVPNNTTGVKAFLGLCNYYRRFVKGFAQIASPLNKLTSKHAKFEWTGQCQEAFERLKQGLISAPILAYPDFTQPFHLFVDASQTGIGLTLGQIIDGKETVVAYAGRDFNPAERNYSAIEREALAVIDGIKRFQSYLYGRKFYVHTDHSALKWLMSVQDPTGRIARWSLLIQQFDFEIIHRAGVANGNADALSRRPYGTCSLNALSSAGLQTDQIHVFQRKDQEIGEIIDYLENNCLPSDHAQARRILLAEDVYFLDVNGLLYHLDRQGRKGYKENQAQLVLPPPLRYEVLIQAHDDLAGGHLGTFKTYEKLRDRFYWRGMYKDIEHWVRSCVDCATRKRPRNNLRAPLLPIPVEGAFDRIAVDCLGPLPVTWSGNRYLVVFTEYLTKWPEIFPVKNIDAETVAKLLVNEIITRHGAPRTLLSDRGKNFLSLLVAEVCKLYSIKKLNTSSYHPATDGLVERMNSTLCQTLSMFVSKNHKDWDVFVPAALFAFRTSPSESTGESPFYLLYGREPRLPLEVSLLPPEDPASSIAEHRRRIVKNIEIAQKIARDNIARAQQKQKEYYDRTAKEANFLEGSKVWVFVPKTKKGLSKKLLHNYHGPYRVVEKLSPVHYRLRTCSNKPVSAIVHANRMKPFTDPNDRPIDPPTELLDELHLADNDFPLDSFVPIQTDTANPDSAESTNTLPQSR